MYQKEAQKGVRTVNRWSSRFRKALKAKSLIPEKQASRLAFDLAELVDACRDLPERIRCLARAIESYEDDSTELMNCAADVASEMEHIREHFRCALPNVRKISRIARNSPPIGSLSDYQLSKQVLEEWHRTFGTIESRKRARASKVNKKRKIKRRRKKS